MLLAPVLISVTRPRVLGKGESYPRSHKVIDKETNIPVLVRGMVESLEEFVSSESYVHLQMSMDSCIRYQNRRRMAHGTLKNVVVYSI